MDAMSELQPLSRKEKRKNRKKVRRKQFRQQAAKEEELSESDEETNRREAEDEIEAQRLAAAEEEEHNVQERLWIQREEEAMEAFRTRQDELQKLEAERENVGVEDAAESTDEDGPAEIIWQGNEIIVKKKRVKRSAKPQAPPTVKVAASLEENPASNPLPPQGVAFENRARGNQQQGKSEHAPKFGTEQDKTNCPFHIKTGVCRFGVRCSRVHVYPEQSFTLLMRNMYTGPGLTSENDEGLEHSEEELAQHYEEFYEDVHSEFLQFGELVNFKVCNNTSLHLRGNVYVHYNAEAAAQAAYRAMNGRFYAGKQITCELVGVTRWRTALCGEYMKHHHRLCSRGTACNFLHCFRNPGGEYDWADWDAKPPRYWDTKMAKLFGRKAYFDTERDDYSDDSQHYGRSRRARRVSRSREHHHHHHHHHSREHFDHPTSHRSRRRHDRDSGRSDNDSDPEKTSRRASLKYHYDDDHPRPKSKDGATSTKASGYSARASSASLREVSQPDLHERWRRSPKKRDQGSYAASSKESEDPRSSLYSKEEKHSRHRKRSVSNYRHESDDNSLRSDFGRDSQGSSSADFGSDSPKSVRARSGPEREYGNVGKRRQQSRRDRHRMENYDNSDSSENGSVEWPNNSRRSHRKHRKRRSIERHGRHGELLDSEKKFASPNFDDRWTGNYEA